MDEAIAKMQKEMVRELGGVEKRVIAKMDAVMGKMQRLESTVVGRTQRTESVAKGGNAGGECDAPMALFIVGLVMLGFYAWCKICVKWLG